MPTQKKTSLPQMPGETGFSLGFFCGMMLGAIGVYVVTTPEGKVFKDHIISDFKKHQQTLASESTTVEPHLVTTLHLLIKKARTYLNNPPNTPKLKEHDKIAILKKKHIFKKK